MQEVTWSAVPVKAVIKQARAPSRGRKGYYPAARSNAPLLTTPPGSPLPRSSTPPVPHRSAPISYLLPLTREIKVSLDHPL